MNDSAVKNKIEDSKSESEPKTDGTEEEEGRSNNIVSIIYNYEIMVRDNSGDLFQETTSTLDRFSKCFETAGAIERGVPEDIGQQWYTRLASAITNYATNPKTFFSLTEIEEISIRKHIIICIFAASGYKDMSHLASLMSSRNQENKLSISLGKTLVLLSLIGLDDIPDELEKPIFSLPKEILFPLVIGWIGQRLVLTKKGEAMRTKILSAGHLIEDITPSVKSVMSLTRAYMHCSYAESPKKHDIKHHFNKIFRRSLESLGINDVKAERVAKTRPRILVLHEHFRSYHAMFRCYEPYIKSLRKYFEVWSMSPKSEIDAKSFEIFDNVITFEDNKILIDMISRKIIEISPDMIYFPSVGMEFWTTLLSNLRLAPIQIASCGHPATTRSENIDYIMTRATNFKNCDSDIFSEIVVALDGPAKFFLHEGVKKALPKKRFQRKDGIVDVAINSSAMKISNRLISCCLKIRANSRKTLRFHFFPAVKGLFYDGIREMIRREISDAKVYELANYHDFLQNLADCDISLAAFPFGNTNGTVDACILGIPTVAHFGFEPASNTDRLVLSSAGYPLWLVANNDDDYVKNAVYAIENIDMFDHFRSDNFREEVKSNLLGEVGESIERFPEYFKYIYENHEKIIEKKPKIIDRHLMSETIKKTS